MRTQLLFYIFFFSLVGNSQVTEDFSDGDFTTNPIWNGTTADYIVNASFELQTSLVVAATSYLNIPHGLSTLDDQEWRFRVKQSFSPSSANYGKVYLCADNPDPTTDPDGFYLQLGESGAVDAVSLYKQVGGASTLICVGPSGSISTSFDYGIKVNRDASGVWTISTDVTGGTNYVFESSGTDVTNLLGTHFIWQCTYTSSNASKFYFDDLYIGDVPVDNVAPILVSAIGIDANLVDVFFNEPLDQVTAEDPNNYDIQPFNSASAAVLDASDPSLVHLTTTQPLANGNVYNLMVSNVEDLAGNDTTIQSTSFIFIIPESPVAGDVIITEIFSDPTPTAGLPELEFVEVYNRSTKFFDLSGWKLGDASSDGTIQSGLLSPGDYRVLCATSSVPSFTNSEAVSSFPSLNNAGDDVVLKDTNGVEIDKVFYTDDWYQDAAKKTGGYTLELINPTLLCSSELNWIASNDNLGGTPGTQNSVYDNTPDTQSPLLVNIFASSPNILTLEFSEPMGALSLQNAPVVVIPTLTEVNRIVAGNQPREMNLFFSPDFAPSQEYFVSVSNIEDCAGNLTGVGSTFVLPGDPEQGDVIINEILFDPLTGGSDYVEVYNASDKVFDLFEWYLANAEDDTVSNLNQILTHKILYPGDYIVITEEPTNVVENYPKAVVENIIDSELPNYSNDEGTVVLMTGFVELDRVTYSDDWHFGLLDTKDGKSLERINALDDSNNPSNWHTAAEDIGFGTPGAENSQFVPLTESGEITFPNKIFSPDNDGFEDVLQIRYKMSEIGLVAKIEIFDASGRAIRILKESELLGVEGLFTWDGLTDDGNKASIGQYIVVFEAFQPNGGTKFINKKVCVLAGKL